MPISYPAAVDMPPTVIAPEHLQAAWLALRAAGYACVGNATSVDEVLARDDVGASLVRLHARLLARGKSGMPDPHALDALTYAHQAPPWRPARRRTDGTTTSSTFDPKRAAAGDRDD